MLQMSSTEKVFFRRSYIQREKTEIVIKEFKQLASSISWNMYS